MNTYEVSPFSSKLLIKEAADFSFLASPVSQKSLFSLLYCYSTLTSLSQWLSTVISPILSLFLPGVFHFFPRNIYIVLHPSPGHPTFSVSIYCTINSIKLSYGDNFPYKVAKCVGLAGEGAK